MSDARTKHTTDQRASYAPYAVRTQRPDDDYDVIRRRDLSLLSCGSAAAVAGDRRRRRRRRCCLQRARAQWVPNPATARAAAKCAIRRRNGDGNTPTDGVHRRRRAPQNRDRRRDEWPDFNGRR